MKKIFFLIVSVVLLFLTGCFLNRSFEIETKIPGADFSFEDESYSTPAKITFKGRNTVTLELTKAGFHPYELEISPKESPNLIEVEMEPVVKAIKISVSTPDASIEYNDKCYRTNQRIPLDYSKPIELVIECDGHVSQDMTLVPGEIEREMRVVLENIELRSFENIVRSHIQNRHVEEFRIISSEYGSFWDYFHLDFYDIDRMKCELFHEVIAEYAYSGDWDAAVFILSNSKIDYLQYKLPFSEESFLDVAIRQDNLEQYQRLVSAGAKVDAYWIAGYPMTDLYKSVEYGSHEILEHLVNTGIDPNEPIWGNGKIEYQLKVEYPLFKAVELGDVKAVELLIGAGANINLEQVFEVNRGENLYVRTVQKIIESDGEYHIEEVEEQVSEKYVVNAR